MPRMTVSDLVDQLDWGRLMNICPRLSNGAIDPRVYAILNRCQPRMLSRGDWIGTTQVVRFCITESCITMPRQVERVDVAKLDGLILDVRNPWFSYMPRIADYCGDGYFWGYGPFSISGANLLDEGYHPAFRDVIPGSKRLRIYPSSPNDVGKEVLINAMDDSNQFIIESTAYSGFKMVLALPYVESNYFVSSILSVIKPKTERIITMYEIGGPDLRMLAIYEPGETTIELRRYRVPNLPINCGCEHSLMALVKLKHIPLERETDMLVVENPSAFEEFIRMLEKKDAGNAEAAITAEADGVRELNLEKRNSSPGTNIPIVIRTQGNAQPWLHGVGRMW